MANRLSYIELPASSTAPVKAFYADAFGFEMSDFGPTYAATTTGEVDLGIQADPLESTQAPLPVIQVESLEVVEVMVRKAGGRITKPIFAFPGGRRFHFSDPAGNELAAMQPT
jgi:predicted enzyme related to lactoylglutathione lyase